ncbi:hypothetical protein ABZX98_19255 [Streptomyces sp. NPDC002992]|uniref:hypothetical protein n=1 Tax=Streptomyces sp. NPDC002992 TaxID=3154273 RepID=UPI0033A4EBC8
MFRSRKPRPAPAPHPTPAQIAAGLRAFAADLEAGDALAVDMAGPRGEMPMDGIEWAAYPTGSYRLARLAHFGGPSPEDLPETA